MANGRSNELTSFLQLLDSELMCGVCLDFFENPIMLPCAHNFCRKCIRNVIDHGRSFSFFAIGPPTSFNCPICQMDIRIVNNEIDNFPTNKPLENIIALYQSCSPIDIFDMAWNRDIQMDIVLCPEHKKEMNRYCESCSTSICQSCEVKHGQRHKVTSLVQVASVLQADIADTLTELKKKTLPVYERIECLESMLKEMETREEMTRKHLEKQIKSLKLLLDAKQETLSLVIHTKVQKASLPVTEQLQRCKLYRTKVQEMMKKLAAIRKTQDVNHRIKLMKDSILQLNIMLQDDFEWCAESTVPECSRPILNLDIFDISEVIRDLQWQEEDEGKKTCTKQTQTDSSILHKDPICEIQEGLNSVKLHTEKVTKANDHLNDSGEGAIESGNSFKDKTLESRQSSKNDDNNSRKEANIVLDQEMIDSSPNDNSKLNAVPKLDSHAGRRSLPFDTFTQKASNTMQKTCSPNQIRNTGVNKFHTSQSDGSLSLRNSTNEALAKFVARRRTLSPFTSDSAARRPSTSPLASDGDSSMVEKKRGAQEDAKESVQALEKELCPKNFSKKPISIKLDFETDV